MGGPTVALWAALGAALAAGMLFGVGLVVSQMIDPGKVLAFLDVAGRWDPSLALVMVGALAVAVPGFRLAQARGAPALGGRYDVPATRAMRSEERRVGKECGYQCRSRWSPYH